MNEQSKQLFAAGLSSEIRLVFRYADEIFSIGAELQDALRGKPTDRPPKVVIGIADLVSADADSVDEDSIANAGSRTVNALP